MPVYEYLCDDCGARTERLLPHERADDPGTCPDCHGPLARRFSRVAVRLEGWGFPRNDAMVPDRPGGRPDFSSIRERAERISEGGA